MWFIVLWNIIVVFREVCAFAALQSFLFCGSKLYCHNASTLLVFISTEQTLVEITIDESKLNIVFPA